MVISMVCKSVQDEPMMIYLAVSVHIGVVNNFENWGGILT